MGRCPETKIRPESYWEQRMKLKNEILLGFEVEGTVVCLALLTRIGMLKKKI
jgi:hypothetical protein